MPKNNQNKTLGLYKLGANECSDIGRDFSTRFTSNKKNEINFVNRYIYCNHMFHDDLKNGTRGFSAEKFNRSYAQEECYNVGRLMSFCNKWGFENSEDFQRDCNDEGFIERYIQCNNTLHDELRKGEKGDASSSFSQQMESSSSSALTNSSKKGFGK